MHPKIQVWLNEKRNYHY